MVRPSKSIVNQGWLPKVLSVRLFACLKLQRFAIRFASQPELSSLLSASAQPSIWSTGRQIANGICMAGLLHLLMPATAAAQSDAEGFQAKNTLLVELGGKGTVYSINYDRIIRQRAGLAWSVRAGAMFLPESKAFGSSLFVPLSLNAITGRKNHHLELSLGQTLRFYPAYMVDGQTVRADADYPITFIGAGYRYQKPGGGRFFSATLLPSFRPFQGVDGLRVDFMPWLGVGIGQSF